MHEPSPDGGSRSPASPDEYQWARYLLAVPIARQLGGRGSEGALRFLERLRGWVGAGQDFAAAEAKEREKQSKFSVYGWRNYMTPGWSKRSKGNRGAPARRRWTIDSSKLSPS